MTLIQTSPLDSRQQQIDLINTRLNALNQDVQQYSPIRSIFSYYIAPFIALITNGLFCSSNLRAKVTTMMDLQTQQKNLLNRIKEEPHMKLTLTEDKTYKRYVKRSLLASGALLSAYVFYQWSMPRLSAIQFSTPFLFFKPNGLDLANHLVYNHETMKRKMKANFPAIYFNYQVLKPIFSFLKINSEEKKLEQCALWKKEFSNLTTSSNSALFQEAISILDKGCLHDRELVNNLNSYLTALPKPIDYGRRENNDPDTFPLVTEPYALALSNRRTFPEIIGYISKCAHETFCNALGLFGMITTKVMRSPRKNELSVACDALKLVINKKYYHSFYPYDQVGQKTPDLWDQIDTVCSREIKESPDLQV